VTVSKSVRIVVAAQDVKLWK